MHVLKLTAALVSNLVLALIGATSAEAAGTDAVASAPTRRNPDEVANEQGRGPPVATPGAGGLARTSARLNSRHGDHRRDCRGSPQALTEAFGAIEESP
jgi:hypothetical protein